MGYSFDYFSSHQRGVVTYCIYINICDIQRNECLLGVCKCCYGRVNSPQGSQFAKLKNFDEK